MILVASIAACGVVRREPLPIPIARPPRPTAGPVLVTASWYGQELSGSRTASGTRFDPGALTAAHRTLPFGTRLFVRNPRNGASTIVTVNDRGPWKRGRDLDLSAAAAKELGIVGRGVARVEMQVVTTDADPRTTGPVATEAGVDR